ncbi:MAG TPA: threonine synthase [Chloroflexia bacterium]|nr:threonine synthase [Chloroflexia bacterium]
MTSAENRTATGSTVSHLECTYCGQQYSAAELHNLCPACGKVLYHRYNLAEARERLKPEMLKGREATMWRYREVMPVVWTENIVSLGEGWTPLLETPRLAARLGMTNLWVKEEGQNPTGSFKARGLCAAVSKAKELGAKAFSIPSAGNAGGALAAYAARAGIPAAVMMPVDAPLINKLETAATGAKTWLVQGLINDAGRILKANADRYGWFDLSTLKEPYRVEGKKTLGYEVAEQMNWEVPDVIIYPTGGGTGLVGMWKAFAEMEELGWIGSKRPRMVVAQATGCAPIVRAFEQGTEFAQPWENAQTGSSGIRVPVAIADYLILQAVRDSGGTCVAVTDDEMREDMIELASSEGIYPAPEGAATLSVLKHLLKENLVSPEEKVVLFNTGTGAKYPEFINFDLPVVPADTQEL